MVLRIGSIIEGCFCLRLSSSLIAAATYISSHLACRTKRWMSDSDFQGTKLLYLPAAVASEVANAPPPPGQLS